MVYIFKCWPFLLLHYFLQKSNSWCWYVPCALESCDASSLWIITLKVCSSVVYMIVLWVYILLATLWFLFIVEIFNWLNSSHTPYVCPKPKLIDGGEILPRYHWIDCIRKYLRAINIQIVTILSHVTLNLLYHLRTSYM